MKPTPESLQKGPSEARMGTPSAVRQAARPGRRLVFFLAGLLALLAALESLVRWNAPLFAAASHRALAKAAMLDQHPRVDILFLGTSRTQDGVSPDLVTRTLEEVASAPGKVIGFNAAFPGSSLDALASLARRFADRPGLRVLAIELSEPQLANAPVPWEISEQPPATLEDRLERGLSAEVCLVRYRSAFLPDNLGRLPALLVFGPALSGWETLGSEQVASWLGHKETPATGFDPARWHPALFKPGAPARTLETEADQQATRLAEIAGYYRAKGVQVVFVIPPMMRAFAPAPERNTLKPLFAEVARRSGCEVWDYASLDLPDGLFHDPSHLGREGRAHFSRALAVQMAGLLGPK